MDRASLIFCTLSLIISISLMSYFYSKAIIPVEKMTGWTKPVQAVDIPDITIGEFGKVSIEELIDYYIENPPLHQTNGALPTRDIRFRGC